MNPWGAPARARSEALGEAAPGSAGAVRLWALTAALLAFLAVAYRALLPYTPETAVRDPADVWFFDPSGTSPQLVYGAVLLLLWRRRHRVIAAAGPPSLSVPGAWLATAGGALLLWAYYVAAPDLLIPSLAALLFGCAGLVAGKRAARALLLPLAVLCFAAPVPAVLNNQVVFHLQAAAAELAAGALRLAGVDAVLSGDRILTSGGIFQVIETCSGWRSMQTLAMSALVYADLFDRRGSRALLLLAISLPIAYVLNGARIIAIVLDPGSRMAEDHVVQGLTALVAGVLMIAAVDGVAERVAARGGDSPEAEAPRRSQRPPRSEMRLALLVGLAAVLAGGSVAIPTFQPAQAAAGRPLYELPAELGDWRASALPYDRDFLGSVEFTQWVHRRYERGEGGAAVDVFLGANDRLDRSGSLLSPKNRFPGSGWTLDAGRSRVVASGDPPVRAHIASRGSQRALVYSWYRGTDGLLAEIVRNALALDNSPFRREGRALFVRLSTPIAPTPSGVRRARERLRRLYSLLPREMVAPRQSGSK